LQKLRLHPIPPGNSLILELEHDIRDFYVLPSLIVGGDLQDDVLLMLRYFLLGDVLNEC
jgi:hypothetical protein